jgi:hypothetical protein
VVTGAALDPVDPPPAELVRVVTGAPDEAPTECEPLTRVLTAAPAAEPAACDPLVWVLGAVPPPWKDPP